MTKPGNRLFQHYPKETEKFVCGGCELKATRTDAEGLLMQIESLSARQKSETEFQDNWVIRNTASGISNQEIKDDSELPKPKISINTPFINAETIIAAVYNSFDLQELKNVGATFNLKDLSGYDWLCLKSFQSGQNRADEKDFQRKSPK